VNVFTGLLFVPLLVANASAEQLCWTLPKESAAYFACGSLNQQERFEKERKQQEQFDRDRKRFDESDQNRKQQNDVSGRRDLGDRDEERRRSADVVAELAPILVGFQLAAEAIKDGKCDPAQKSLSETIQRIQLAKADYYKDGKELKREELRDWAVHVQAAIFGQCAKDPRRKVHEYLKREAKNGSKAAAELLADLQSGSGDVGQVSRKNASPFNGKLPRIGDYGTDIGSLQIYTRDLRRVPEELCREMAKRGNPDGVFCAYLHESGSDEIALLREAARLGHPIAQNNLAMKLDDGTIENSPEIVRLIKASAKKGIPHAQVTLGWWYMTGSHGFAIDYASAMAWNLKGYKQGHSEGANNIGELYESGLGVPKDIKQAVSWYRKASVLGNAEATERLENLSH